MADISGPGGNYTTNTAGFYGHISGWAANLNPTVVENTGFPEVGNRTFVVTAQSISGSADGTAATGLLPFAAGITGSTPTMSSYQSTLTLTSAASQTWTFPAVISGVSLVRRHDGKADIAFNFISSGPITQSWS